jgi:hypothetical protein
MSNSQISLINKLSWSLLLDFEILSYFLKTNIKLYCIYQCFMSINSFFNTVSVSRYSRPISDPWPTFYQFFLNNVAPTFQTQNDNFEAINPFVFGIIKNRIKILPKHLYYYMVCTCVIMLFNYLFTFIFI